MDPDGQENPIPRVIGRDRYGGMLKHCSQKLVTALLTNRSPNQFKLFGIVPVMGIIHGGHGTNLSPFNDTESELFHQRRKAN